MSIGRKLTIFVLLFSGVFTLIGTVLQLFFDYEQGVDDLEATFALIDKSHINSLTNDVWHMDEHNLETQLSEIMSLPDVAYLNLDIPNLSSTTKGIRPEPHLEISRTFDLYFNVQPQGKQVLIGSLTVAVTLEAVFNELKDKLVVILLTQGIKILFVSVFIIFLFHLLVTRHLEHISKYLATTTIDSLSKPLTLFNEKSGSENNREDSQNELEILVRAINGMRTDLSDEIIAKQETEQQLRQEIDDRLEAQSAVHASEAQLRTLIETLPDLVWLKDPYGVYLFCNPKFAESVGKDIDSIVGKTDLDIYGKAVALALREKDHTVMSQGIPSMDEEEVSYAVGGHKELHETVRTPVLSSEGQAMGVLGVSRNITERRQAEKALRRAQKMDAVGQLTGGIAHDFNNILGIILGNLSLLKNQIKSDQGVLKRVETIEKSAQRAAALTRQLLGFSRRQAAKVTLTNINHLIQGMDTLLARSLTPEVSLKQHFSDSIWSTEIDPGDFEDALLNLVLNARDAMPSGGELTLETTNRTITEDDSGDRAGVVPGDYVVLIVRDTGNGISNEELEHIFEPFYTTKPQGKGTGLGLAMVFGFVNRSSGYITIDTELNKGTQFNIFLPRSEGELIAEQDDEPVEPEMPRGSETILVVDDEEELVALAKESLQLLGYNVITASSGQEALSRLSEHSGIDLLFSDVVMPGGLNGYELADQASELNPGIKVLLTSGYTDKSSGIDQIETRRSYRLLNKPYSRNDLAEHIRVQLGNDQLNSDGIDAPGFKPIDWKPSFSTGIDAIDDDHKDLLAILNRCQTLVGRADESLKLEELLTELWIYTRHHFSREEAVMTACEYPGLSTHTMIHQLLIKQLASQEKRFKNGELTAQDMAEFLSHWLMDHIRDMDTAFKSHCKGKEREISAALDNIGLDLPTE